MAWNSTDLVNGTVPLWAQLADRFREGIADGEIPAGSDLPSESQIVARFGVSRATARSALNQLATEGRVERRSGKGTKVLTPPVELPLNVLASFAEDMTSRGLAAGYSGISVTIEPVTDPMIARALDIAPATKSICLKRLLLADDQVIALSVSWLSPSLLPTTESESARAATETSLYVWLEERHGLRVARGTEVIAAAVADAELAARLEIPLGSAVLHATRTALLQDGRPVEHVERFYRADRYRYRMELVRP